MGGATAVAYQVESATKGSTAEATVKNVTITLGEADASPVFTDPNSKDKGAYFEALKSVIGIVDLNNLSVDGLLAAVSNDENEDKVQAAIDVVWVRHKLPLWLHLRLIVLH